jgi:hypothetical protein
MARALRILAVAEHLTSAVARRLILAAVDLMLALHISEAQLVSAAPALAAAPRYRGLRPGRVCAVRARLRFAAAAAVSRFVAAPAVTRR